MAFSFKKLATGFFSGLAAIIVAPAAYFYHSIKIALQYAESAYPKSNAAKAVAVVAGMIGGYLFSAASIMSGGVLLEAMAARTGYENGFVAGVKAPFVSSALMNLIAGFSHQQRENAKQPFLASSSKRSSTTSIMATTGSSQPAPEVRQSAVVSSAYGLYRLPSNDNVNPQSQAAKRYSR